jgi:hypothetical protein
MHILSKTSEQMGGEITTSCCFAELAAHLLFL